MIEVQTPDTIAPPEPPTATAAYTIAKRSWPPKSIRLWLGLAGIASAIILFELMPRLGLVNPTYAPPFSQIMGTLFTQLLPESTFWIAVGNTLLTWAIGLAIVVVSGLITGILIGAIPVLRALTTTTIEFLRPIPSVALIPLAIAVFGIDRAATLVLVIYAAFWQIFMQVQYGVRDVDPVARDTAHAYRFKASTTATKVIWPTVLPYAVTGFRLAASVALILTITGELIIGSDGIGRLIVEASSAGNYSQMYALIVVTGLLGLAVNLMVRAFERRLLRWHPSVRLEVMS